MSFRSIAVVFEKLEGIDRSLGISESAFDDDIEARSQCHFKNCASDLAGELTCVQRRILAEAVLDFFKVWVERTKVVCGDENWFGQQALFNDANHIALPGTGLPA